MHESFSASALAAAPLKLNLSIMTFHRTNSCVPLIWPGISSEELYQKKQKCAALSRIHPMIDCV
jgi:hypothetical protein